MDARKGKKLHTDGRIKRRNTVQTWRAVSSQPFHEGDGESRKLQGQLLEDLRPETSAKEGSVDKDLRPSKKHSISVDVGWALIRFIKQKGGVTQEEIESELGVKIIFPLSAKEDHIIIEGSSVESCSKASEKVQTIINKAVNSRDFDYTHFVSLPLAVHPGLVERLFAFQKKILGVTESSKNNELGADSSGREDEGQNSGVDKSIFINPKTFHLTVLMLKLWNKDRVKAAAEVLQSVSSKVIEALENRPVSIKLKGLDCMRGSLAKARVLYAPVEGIGGEGRLLKSCQVIIDAFVAAGLVMEMDTQNKLKLHATLMNVRHRKRRKGRRNLDYFDARRIFELYGAEDWGDYRIREAHLSQRFAYDESGYYHCCGSIPFPPTKRGHAIFHGIGVSDTPTRPDTVRHVTRH